MLLSIIIPVYKVEKYIGKTLDSISAQNDCLSNVEVIVVNDGTPDNSMEIVNAYTGKIQNLVIIEQSNGGLSSARNTGLKRAKGKYVWFVDSDDWLERDSIGRVTKELNADIGKTDIFCFKIREYGEAGDFLCEKYFPFKDITYLEGTSFLLSSISFAPMQQYMIKREFLENNCLLFAEGVLHEDIEFAPKMLMKARQVCVIPEVSYCYLRRSGDNITGNKNSINEKRLKSLSFILREYIDMEQGHKDKITIRCLKKIQRIATLATYNFSSLEQIKTNYLDAFGKKQRKLHKRVIYEDIKYNTGGFIQFLWEIIFIVSPVLYKKLSIYRQSKKIS